MDKQKKKFKWDNYKVVEKLKEARISYPQELRRLNLEDILHIPDLTYKERIYLMHEIENTTKRACKLMARKFGKRSKEIERGDVFLANLTHRTGKETLGIRPVLVIQNNCFSDDGDTVIVAPISIKGESRISNSTTVKAHNTCEDIDCLIQMRKITSIDRSRLLSYMWTISSSEMNEVNSILPYIFQL